MMHALGLEFVSCAALGIILYSSVLELFRNECQLGSLHYWAYNVQMVMWSFKSAKL